MEGFPFRFCAAERGGAAESEEGGFGRDVGVEAEGEEEDAQEGKWVREKWREEGGGGDRG